MITLLHLGQSVHEFIVLAMDSITLLFFIITSTQDCALVMLGSSYPGCQKKNMITLLHLGQSVHECTGLANQ